MEPNDIDKEDFMLPQKTPELDKPAPPIRTFSTDLAQAVRKDEMSVIKVAMAEEKRRHEEEQATSAAAPKNKMYLITGTIFILVAIAGIALVSVVRHSRAPLTQNSETVAPTIIPAEASTSLEIGGMPDSKIVELLKTAVSNVTAGEGEIVNIYFTDSTGGQKRIVPAQVFLVAIKSEIPGALARTLSTDFMLGTHKSADRHPFIIFRTNDYGIAFAGMFEWERDLFSDFYIPLNLTGDEENFTNKFSDLLVDNKDTRVLLKDDGTASMIYGFADERTIVIAGSVETFREVLRRLQAAR